MASVRMRLGALVELRPDGGFGEVYRLPELVEELAGAIDAGEAERFEIDAAEIGLRRALAMLRRCRSEFNLPRSAY